jgi:hypothetical protein
VIGKGGTSVDQLRDELEKRTGKRVRVTIQEIKKPELSAQLVAENVAAQLEKRIAFRRAIKQSLMKTMRAGAQGVKIRVKGRLGGSEMGRIEWNREGRVPLHTLKADIDFGQTEAKTTFGRIGVSAWVYTGNFPTDTPARVVPTVTDEPADGGVPVASILPEIPVPVAALMTAEVAVAPSAPAVTAEAPAATSEAPAKPKRATRAVKAAAAGTETAAKPKRATRAKTEPTAKAEPAAKAETTDAAAAPKTPRARAKKKE